MLSRAAGRARSVDQATAVDLWWAWLAARVAEDREAWDEWLWDLVAPPSGEFPKGIEKGLADNRCEWGWG